MDEDNSQERSRKTEGQFERHNQRVRAFSDRTDLDQLSPREYADAYAEVLRPQNIEMLSSFERMGWMGASEDRHKSIREAFIEFGFDLIPRCGWDEFLFELDLIFVQFDIPDTRKGHSELRREVEACIERLESIRETFLSFNHNIDFSVAAMLSNANVSGHFDAINELIKSHKIVAAWLAENAQPPRWRNKVMREKRVELATKLMTIFHREFGLMPKPDGGSAHLPIEQANEWQRFFQACALIRLTERATPDRQAILWEAYRNW